MSLFWDNAQKLMDAAISASGVGCATESMTVVIGAEGGIHILAHNDWPLDRLREERGARMAYRVEHADGRISVTGSTGTTSCRLESDRPELAIQKVLRDNPRYLL